MIWRFLGWGRRMHDSLWDRRLGIETVPIETIEPEAAARDPYVESPTPYFLIHRILQRITLNNDDVFVDVGCGTGRVVSCVARHPVRRAAGVELMEGAARQANANLTGLRQRRAESWQIHQGDASDFDYSSATLIFLFNPFGPETMSRFLAALSEGQSRRPDGGPALRMVYFNPALRQMVLDESSWIRDMAHHVVLRHEFDIYSAAPSKPL